MTALRHPVRRLLAPLVVVLAVAGCAGTTDADNSTNRQPESRQTDGPGDSDSSGQMKDDISSAVKSIETYWTSFFEAQGGQFSPVKDVFPYDSPSDGNCGGEAFAQNNAFFCPSGDFIAYDEIFLSREYRDIGDAFVYYLFGHEYAHAEQAALGISHRLTIQHELQADCMAGAYLGDSVRAGSLEIEDGDIDELLDSLALVGDQPGVPWFAEGAHGSGEQRTQAFAAGYQGTSAGGSSLNTCFQTF